MTVNITFSKTPSGQTMEDTQDSGTVIPGAASSAIDIYVKHDADYAPITECAWYLTRCVSDRYEGSSPDEDLAEVLEWGNDGKGFQINQLPPFASENWESFNSNNGTINNQFGLPKEAVTTGTPVNAGEIPVNGEAHVQVKWIIPNPLEGDKGAGYRGVTLVFAYSATS